MFWFVASSVASWLAWKWWEGRTVSTVAEPPRIRTLDSLSAAFRPLATQLLKDAETIGIPLDIVEARRSTQRQAWLYGQGRIAPASVFNGIDYAHPGPIVTKARPGKGKHETGDAIDVWPKHLGYTVDEVKAATALLERVERDCGTRLGLKNEPIPGDHAHFEKA